MSSVLRGASPWDCSWLVAWTGMISACTPALNVNWVELLNDSAAAGEAEAQRRLHPGDVPPRLPGDRLHLPHSPRRASIFIPRMFQGFPEIKEALIANKMQAGVHRRAAWRSRCGRRACQSRSSTWATATGSAVVVQKDGPVKTLPDLRGKTIAIPSRFSDERLIVLQALEKYGMKAVDVKMVEMAPPDVAGALAAQRHRRLLDGRALPVAGGDRRLRPRPVPRAGVLAGLHVLRAGGAPGRDRRPARMPCRRSSTASRARGSGWRWEAAPRVRRRVSSAATTTTNRPLLLRWALTKPLDRVMYTPSAPRKPDFDLVRDLMIETGVLDRKLASRTTSTRASPSAPRSRPPGSSIPAPS